MRALFVNLKKFATSGRVPSYRPAIATTFAGAETRSILCSAHEAMSEAHRLMRDYYGAQLDDEAENAEVDSLEKMFSGEAPAATVHINAPPFDPKEIFGESY